MTRRLIAMRHGQTDWNAESRVQGQTDVPLNAAGRQQIVDAAPVVAKLAPTTIVASDLSRALDTANAVAAITGHAVEIDERLREIFCGQWEGLTMTEVAEKFPEEFAMRDVDNDFSRGGGESRMEAGRRVGDAIAEHLRRPDVGDTLLAVGHGMSMRVALEYLGETGVVRLAEPPPRMGNASFIIAEVVD